LIRAKKGRTEEGEAVRPGGGNMSSANSAGWIFSLGWVGWVCSLVPLTLRDIIIKGRASIVKDPSGFSRPPSDLWTVGW